MSFIRCGLTRSRGLVGRKQIWSAVLDVRFSADNLDTMPFSNKVYPPERISETVSRKSDAILNGKRRGASLKKLAVSNARRAYGAKRIAL